MYTTKKVNSTLTIESFIDSPEYNKTDPIRIECGVTNDASIFKPYFGQRPVNEPRCRKMSRSMEKHGNFSSVQCVRKGSHLYVWDGQHVLKAAILAGKPINYDIYNRVPKYILSLKNADTKAWTLEVTHNYFLDMGEEVAVEVQNFIEDVSVNFNKPIKLTAALRLLSGSYSNQAYRDRTYKITQKEKAYEVVECLQDIAKYVYFATDSKFVSSFQQVYDCGIYDHSVMKERIKNNWVHLHNQLKIVDIVKGIENCYNYNTKSSNRVDFVKACGLKSRS
jgi:hypothetical protein